MQDSAKAKHQLYPGVYVTVWVEFHPFVSSLVLFSQLPTSPPPLDFLGLTVDGMPSSLLLVRSQAMASNFHTNDNDDNDNNGTQGGGGGGGETIMTEGGIMFQQNMSEFVQVDRKVFFAAADRNKDVILEQLKPILDKAQSVLEIGSGSGQHIYRFSKDYPNVTFQPTEYGSCLLPSIDAYADDLIKEGHHIKPALELDATNPEHWQNVREATGQPQQSSFDLVVTTNVFHISPWIVSQSIVRGAGQVLKSGGYLVVYGPFKRGGEFNTESNREFDKTLRGRDPSWGVRDIEEIETVAKNEADMTLEKVMEMPANNYMLFFQKK